ncbi:hypothetical protein EAE96_008321 [Botrytis aclada]|nr:hypothetical protein EAE96_008321 [Botrytis aclada]
MRRVSPRHLVLSVLTAVMNLSNAKPPLPQLEFIDKGLCWSCFSDYRVLSVIEDSQCCEWHNGPFGSRSHWRGTLEGELWNSSGSERT